MEGFDRRLLAHIAERYGLSLQPETEVSNRRGAKLLKLWGGERYFGLKLANGAESSLAREAAVSKELESFTRTYIGSGTYEGVAWLLLDWVAGQSVYRYVKQLRSDSGLDAELKLVELFALMALSVADLHTFGYLHGDLQPDHFRIIDGKVHLLDFALAHRADEPFNYPGALVHFSAPEVCRQQLESKPVRYDVQAELYSLASVLFFLYTGQLSADYGGEIKSLDLEGKRARIALGHRNTFASTGCEPFAELEQVLEKCLAFDKQERYSSAADVAQTLRELSPSR